MLTALPFTLAAASARSYDGACLECWTGACATWFAITSCRKDNNPAIYSSRSFLYDFRGNVPEVTIFVCNGFAVSLARYAASRGLMDFGFPLEYAVVDTLILFG